MSTQPTGESAEAAAGNTPHEATAPMPGSAPIAENVGSTAGSTGATLETKGDWLAGMSSPWVHAALVAAFLAHLVFINVAVGGSLLALLAARGDEARRRLGMGLARAAVVALNLGVALGVGPLLLIGLAYPRPFYTAVVLLAPAWLAVPPLVALALGTGYLYAWESRRFLPERRNLHRASGFVALSCLLLIPLVYLTMTSLMWLPGAWRLGLGFFEVLWSVGNVLPRYFHFLLASLAIAGLFLALWGGRRGQADREVALAMGIQAALGATSLQFLAGPIVLVTLPVGALSGPAIASVGLGILFGLVALFTLADAVRDADPDRRHRKALAAALVLTGTLVGMGTGRHLIREALLARPEAREVLDHGPKKREAVREPQQGVGRGDNLETRRGMGRGASADELRQVRESLKASGEPPPSR